MPPARRSRPRASARRSKLPQPAEPGLSRVDQPSTRTHGYVARLGYEKSDNGRWRPKFTKFFGDISHGGAERALTAARKWVRHVRRTGKPPRD